MKVDLHIHTTFSDGRLTPAEVVKISHEMGLRAIAITDHDTVEGIPYAIEESRKYKNIEVIPGIEINTYYSDQEVHILGYFIEYNNVELKKKLSDLLQKRIERTRKITEKLIQLGINITFEEIKSRAQGPSIGRPHVARALIDKGYANSIEDAFDKFLNPGRPAYVPRYKITPFDAVDIIKLSNGIPVLAHPGLLGKKQIINELIDYGIMGIEVYHKDHNMEQVKYYMNIASEKKLLMTGGSDSHGETPLLLGTLDIPREFVLELKYEKNKCCM
ncbi:MAG TPA: PHP domain-containing protein [Thermoanaerobacterales bacterium]|nr:PHP domain-containing protein [Thermoanaerobacterales bacterium]